MSLRTPLNHRAGSESSDVSIRDHGIVDVNANESPSSIHILAISNDISEARHRFAYCASFDLGGSGGIWLAASQHDCRRL